MKATTAAMVPPMIAPIADDPFPSLSFWPLDSNVNIAVLVCYIRTSLRLTQETVIIYAYKQ